MKRALLAAAAATLAACFNPTFNDKTCGVNGECPAGFTCVSDVCRAIDAADADAPIDAVDTPPPNDSIDAPDASGVTVSGQIVLLEAQFLNQSTTYFGQGIVASITFTASGQVPAPVLEEVAGSLIGCKAWDYTPSEATAARLGVDEGPVQISSPNTSLSFPPCTYATGLGYWCPEMATSSGGGMIAMGPVAGTVTLTDGDVTYNAANSSNRYVKISGAMNPGNNGLFPIVAVVNASTILYGNPGFVAETLPAPANHINVAGVGPMPTETDPGFLPDNANVDVVHTAGGGNHIPGFTASAAGSVTVGDDFNLPAADLTRLNNIPTTGMPFTFACSTADCPASSAHGTMLELITTDASTTGQSQFALPPPIVRQAVVRCVGLATNTVTVPAAYSAILMASGATRIQATFARLTLLSNSPANVVAVAGHAIVGFTDPTGACNDSVDNDGDGRVDFPNDPGCTSPADNDENDGCPADPGCPQCSDGQDNDADTLTDYPMDTGCTSASDNSE